MPSMIWDAPSIISRSRGFANGPQFPAPSSKGMPVSEFDEDCDQIPNFDHLADLVEEHSHA